jgi:hypothetical protein
MATNRHEIWKDALATLKTITTANGYLSEVGPSRVHDEFKDYDEFAPAELPALCCYPAKPKGPPPVYEAFGSIQESIDLTIVGHVAGETQMERGEAMSALEQDVRDALGVDPTRGGWGIDTTKVQPEETDEGVPDKEGQHAGTATFVLAVRVTYYPDD